MKAPKSNTPLAAGTALAHLVWRIGREAGEFCGLLRDNEISWGYYCDHNPFEPHNNAHPNNFLVLPPGHPTYGRARVV